MHYFITCMQCLSKYILFLSSLMYRHLPNNCNKITITAKVKEQEKLLFNLSKHKELSRQCFKKSKLLVSKSQLIKSQCGFYMMKIQSNVNNDSIRIVRSICYNTFCYALISLINTPFFLFLHS